jgi:hypothetical protein
VETVFSHPSKLDLIDTAQTAGYTVVLHAVRIPEELAVLRVRHRVDAGGHDVPEDKIRPRYRRLWDLVAAATARADSATSTTTAPSGDLDRRSAQRRLPRRLRHLAELDTRRADRAVARRHLSGLAAGVPLAGRN